MATRGELKKALIDWITWFRKFSEEMVIRQHSIRFPSGLCLALTGVRRSGKTSMAVQMSKELKKIEHTLYFNFEDPIFFSGASVEIIDTLITVYEEEFGHTPFLVILDEVHNVKGWERWVRKAVDIGQFKVIVTGSSSQLLSSEIATAISGRVIEQTVWPLSFVEYLSFQNLIPSTEGVWIKNLNHYLQWGGFPKVVLTNDETEKTILLKQYLSDIVFRDVIGRHSIKNQHALHQVVTWYLSGLSCLHSYNAVRKAFGMSIELASLFTNYLSQAFLVFEVNRYHHNLKIQIRDPKKIYIVDSGLRTVSLFSKREDWGHLAENAVYLELRRRKKEIYYFNKEKEVDFVITELGKPTQIIQVSYSNLDHGTTKDREISSLIECLEFVKINKGTILTLAYEDKQKFKGFSVEFVPIFKWLQG